MRTKFQEKALAEIIEYQQEMIEHALKCYNDWAEYLTAHGVGITKEQADDGSAIMARIVDAKTRAILPEEEYNSGGSVHLSYFHPYPTPKP